MSETSDVSSSDVVPSEIAVVAVGASAGGLEPLERFFNSVAPQSNVAYVIVQHLSPDYRSMMNEILSRKSSITIKHIDDGTALEANTIFLNRPNMYAELVGDTFRTRAYRDEDGLPHLPIDHMLSSLAKRSPDRTVGVILSGSGTDGTRGAKALYHAGGTVLVQSTNEAAFVSMPRSALLSGCVDRVLPASEMPQAIEDILTYGKKGYYDTVETMDPGINSILHDLETHTNVDFSSYKPANVHRRIERRQTLRGYGSVAEYSEAVNQSPDVLDELYRDLLIGVTEFYRDTEAMSALRSNVLDALAAERGDVPIKIWVPGCASGEEAYTIAIEMSEALRAAGSDRRFRIIATDVHARSVDTASRGVYSEDKIAKVPRQLRDRYFVRQDGDYLIDPVLRQRIIFSVHNVLNDPPFMNLDLISCRNMLIYLREEPQVSVISMFLFGLRHEGYLFLGGSESVGKFKDAFDVVDARWRLFQKSGRQTEGLNRHILSHKGIQTRSYVTPLVDHRPPPRAMRQSLAGEMREVRSRETLVRSYDILLKRYAPASILLTVEGQVLNWFGAAEVFIDTMQNLAEWTVQDIVHPDLHFPINVGIEKLRQGHFESFSRSTEVNMADGSAHQVMVEIEPLSDTGDRRLILAHVTFEGAAPDQIAAGSDAALEAEAEARAEAAEAAVDAALVPTDGTELDDRGVLSKRIHELERDLRLTEETLQHVTERLEASGEELQASNEELQASNEELQASNEELQSSNEELHAVNEELLSLSAEHERKISLLSELNQSTELVLKILNTGILLLDGYNHILRFSSLIERDFLLQPHDVSRNLSTVGPRVDFADLEDLLGGLEEGGGPVTAQGSHEGRELLIEARYVTLGAEQKGEGGKLVVFRWV